MCSFATRSRRSIISDKASLPGPSSRIQPNHVVAIRNQHSATATATAAPLENAKHVIPTRSVPVRRDLPPAAQISPLTKQAIQWRHRASSNHAGPIEPATLAKPYRRRSNHHRRLTTNCCNGP